MRTDKHETAQQMADSMVFREALMLTMPSKALKRRQWVMTDWGRRQSSSWWKAQQVRL